MGTRSDIIAHCNDGKWRRIYCHWDGYLAHNGVILMKHYQDQTKIEALLALGDISKLAPEIGVKHSFEGPPRFVTSKKSGKSVANRSFTQYEKQYGDMCLAYGRDRGEKDTEATVGDSLAAAWPPVDTWTEFAYVWKEGAWWVGSSDDGSQALVLLADALAAKVPVTPAVKMPLGVIGRHKPLTKPAA